MTPCPKSSRLSHMSERPPKPPEKPKESIPPAESDIVFVGPEEDAEPAEKTAEDLGDILGRLRRMRSVKSWLIK